MQTALRLALVLLITAAAGAAHAQPTDDDCSDADCQIDLTADECA
ncbi:MAG: hypothetical protein JWM53_5654, partial [bacterium]|nr:hypothetical protein [bacterium]